MTQYLLSVYMTESDETMSEDEIQRIYQAVDDFNEKVKSAGAWVFAGGLEPVESSTTVDGTKSDPIVTDGPFAESKELISYAVYDVRSREEAMEWATRFVRLHQEHWAGWEGEADVQQVFGAPPAP
jgi:hypothetical protein